MHSLLVEITSGRTRNRNRTTLRGRALARLPGAGTPRGRRRIQLTEITHLSAKHFTVHGCQGLVHQAVEGPAGGLRQGAAACAGPAPLPVQGKLTRVGGLTLEAVGLPAVIGSRCLVRQPGLADIEAEVVGFEGDVMSLMPIDPVNGLGPSARVLPLRHGALEAGAHGEAAEA